jgi:hypothetical protein
MKNVSGITEIIHHRLVKCHTFADFFHNFGEQITTDFVVYATVQKRV